MEHPFEGHNSCELLLMVGVYLIWYCCSPFGCHHWYNPVLNFLLCLVFVFWTWFPLTSL